METTRMFVELTDIQKKRKLLFFLNVAIGEIGSDWGTSDLIDIACQCGGRYKVTRNDFYNNIPEEILSFYESLV